MARGRYIDSVRGTRSEVPQIHVGTETTSEDRGQSTKRNVEESFKGGIGNFAGATKFLSSVVDRIKYLEERDNSTNGE